MGLFPHFNYSDIYRFFFSGIFTTVPSLDAFAQRLVHLAFTPSTHRNIKSHVNVYTRFCHSVRASPFPVQIDLLIRYVAYLTLSGRTYATIINHIGSLKHVNQLLGFGKVWDTHYRFQLVLRGVKRHPGVSPKRKHPITPEILLQVYSHFTLAIPLHAAMWAWFLVTFFTFLRKSNLVPDVADRISTKVPLRADLEFSSQGASLHIKACRTIQYQQRSLSIPLPCIPGSPLCLVRALRHHLRIRMRRFSRFFLPRLTVNCPSRIAIFPSFFRGSFKRSA